MTLQGPIGIPVSSQVTPIWIIVGGPWSLARVMRLLLRTDGLEQAPIVPWKQVQAALKVNAVLLSCFAMQQDDPRQLLTLELEALVSMRGIYFQQRLLCGVIIRSMPCHAMPCICCFH